MELDQFSADWPNGKIGYCAIIGRPNVGKSTFMNQILQYHLAAVSERPHTTRKRWLGIFSDDEKQIIFTDTPGVHDVMNKMHEEMSKGVKASIQKNDVVLVICDATREFGDEDEMVCGLLEGSEKQVILAVNKTDQAQKKQIRDIKLKYLKQLGKKTPVYEISAKHGNKTNDILAEIAKHLPEGPFLYPKDQVADCYLRDIAEEVIREKANHEVYKEVPHSLAIKIDRWKETEKKVVIDATIFVERTSQKQILVGAGGKTINRIIKKSREQLHKDIEKFIELKVFVKVSSDWQNKSTFLKDLGLVNED